MKTPLISVILPFFNSEGTLDRAIQSVVDQDFRDFELILIDNNSSDGGINIAKEWCSRDLRILLLHEDRQGVVFASNKGASTARGSYLARMDADDVSLPERLGLQKGYLDKHPETGAVAGLIEHVAYAPNTDGIARFVDWSNSLKSHEELYLNRFIEFPLVNPSLMWRKEIGEQYGLYKSGDFPEDYEMILRWFAAGIRVEKIPHTLLKWYDSPERLTRTHEAYTETAFYSIKSSYLATWLSENNPHHPDVTIWGASRISRKRVSLLENLGVRAKAYIDIRKDRQPGKEIIYYKDLPAVGETFILVYLGHERMREQTLNFLKERDYREGVDFLLVS